MILRRALFAVSLGLAAVLASSTVFAIDLKPYEAGPAQGAIKSGAPVVIHVYASWCLQCHMQASILSRLPADPALAKIQFFRVDYDDQADVVKALNCPRSTLIAYRGGKEVARMSWGTSQDDVVRILRAAL